MRAIAASVFALVLVSPAYASDYYSDYVYDWTGIYGGVHAGFIQANVNVDARAQPIEGDILDLSYERDLNGFVGGALGGVNFQAGSFVFGLDMDFGGVATGDGKGTAHLEGTVNGEVFEEDIRFQHGLDWNAHVRGRLGFALDRVLFYGAGGLAVADFDVKSNRSLLGDNDLDDGGHATGWSAGGGIEYAVTDNLLVRAEYLHDEYINEKGICGLVLGCNSNDGSVFRQIGSTKLDFTDNIFRVGVSWKFTSGMGFDGGTTSSGMAFDSGGTTSSAGLTLGTAAPGGAIPKSVAHGPAPSIAPQTLRSTTGLIQNQQNQQMRDGSRIQPSSIQYNPESPGQSERSDEDSGSGQLSYPAAIERVGQQ
jgi:outer membrane immunogenic protein